MAYLAIIYSNHTVRIAGIDDEVKSKLTDDSSRFSYSEISVSDNGRFSERVDILQLLGSHHRRSAFILLDAIRNFELFLFHVLAVVANACEFKE